MAEPITIGVAVITGLVNTYKAYIDYKTAVAKAQADKAPVRTEEVAKGEKIAEVVKAGIAQHGSEDERTDLASFERHPQRYNNSLARVISDIASREHGFAQQLQTLAQEVSIQTDGVQGSVNINGGKVYGAVVGVNTGTISGTYTINDKDA